MTRWQRSPITALAVVAVGVLGMTAACTASGNATGPGSAPSSSPASPKPQTTSPIDGEPRTTTTATALSALLVTAREPAVPFTGSDNMVTVTYELVLENATPLPLTPTKVEVLAPSGAVLQSLDQAAISAALQQPSRRQGVQQLGEAQTATLNITLKFPNRSDVPARLDNRITVRNDRLPGGSATTSAAATVSGFAPPVLGPPLEPGSRYIAADSCCDSVRHRRALLPVDNHVWLVQRFAVDWEQLDDQNRTVHGTDPTRPADYTIYGKRAIAAADGTVIQVLNGLPDQPPGALPPTANAAEVDGNSVVIDIGGGVYMLYAHLQNGSIAVQQGQRVTRGQLLGLVGNSGNTSAPHLHFHVMDGPSPLTSEGVPYEIESFTTNGQITSTEAFDKLENTTQPLPLQPLPIDGAHRNQMPLDRDLVTFS